MDSEYEKENESQKGGKETQRRREKDRLSATHQRMSR